MRELPSGFEMFRGDIWETMSPTERRHLLQDVENHVAKEQNRQPRAIIASKMGSISDCGGYDQVTPYVLSINEDHLNDESAKKGYNYVCLDTILHEGRHGFQDDAIQGKLTNDPEKTQIWKENSAAYKCMQQDPAYYRFQPLEADAHEAGYSDTDQIHTAIGNDPSYEKYMEMRKNSDKFCEDQALKMYGLDYESEISHAVHDNYMDTHSESQSHETSPGIEPVPEEIKQESSHARRH